MLISVAHDFLPKRNSVRASQVMDHFGIDFEQGRHVIAADLDLPIELGQVVLFTGASGSGKSSLMRAVRSRLEADTPGRVGKLPSTGDGCPSNGAQAVGPVHLVSLDDLKLPETLLIDSLELPAEEAMNLLSTCGLGEAHLMLRTPMELSDGQRYRFRLALALALRPAWVVADEFTATLDRTLAKVIAFNIRRLADRTGIGFLLATTHEDIATDLSSDIHVRCRLDGQISVHLFPPGFANSSVDGTKDESFGHQRVGSRKKKDSSLSTTTSGSPQRPVTTGRISLGGITAATSSVSPAN